MSTPGTPSSSTPRRLAQRVAGPVTSYVDRMFADVHHRLDEVFLEVSRGREDVAALRDVIGQEVDVIHEVVLGLERRIAELSERLDAATPGAPDVAAATDD